MLQLYAENMISQQFNERGENLFSQLMQKRKDGQPAGIYIRDMCEWSTHTLHNVLGEC